MESSSANPPSYFKWSIFTTLCCCLPLGVIALFFSNQVNTANTAGDTTKAAEASRKAKIMNIIGVVTGAIFITIIIIIYAINISAVLAISS